MNWRLINVSADTKNIQCTFQLSQCFFEAGMQLYANTADGYVNSLLTKEMYDRYLLPALYLFRHAVELIMKALLELFSVNKKKSTHNLQKLWEHIESVSNDLTFSPENKNTISEALATLNTYELRDNEEIIRYFKTNGGKIVNTIPSIDNTILEKIIRAYNRLREFYTDVTVQKPT